jgi:hypothetical protein
MKARQVLAGRREGELLAFPSVQRMANILSERCREASWVRTSVASLDRFRTMTGHSDLEAFLQQATAEPAVAEQALAAFASALAGYTESQVSGLAMGAKIWFRLNGVAVAWRPLAGMASPPALPTISQQGVEHLILLALIGSGLQLAELLRLRLGDVGSLDSEGRLIPDIEADPLAVQFTPHRGKHTQRITFLTYQARQALLAFLEHTPTAGQPLDPTMPLIAQSDGSKVTSASVHQARRRSRSLIQACSNTNVALCRATGDFFREWGLPGSRFEGPEELNIEEYI